MTRTFMARMAVYTSSSGHSCRRWQCNNGTFDGVVVERWDVFQERSNNGIFVHNSINNEIYVTFAK